MRSLLLVLLLSACAPKFVYSRAALPDEQPFDAEVKVDMAASVNFSGVGAIVVGGKSNKSLSIVQCLACHRMAEHPPVRKDATRFEWKQHQPGE